MFDPHILVVYRSGKTRIDIHIDSPAETKPRRQRAVLRQSLPPRPAASATHLARPSQETRRGGDSPASAARARTVRPCFQQVRLRVVVLAPWFCDNLGSAPSNLITLLASLPLLLSPLPTLPLSLPLSLPSSLTCTLPHSTLLLSDLPSPSLSSFHCIASFLFLSPSLALHSLPLISLFLPSNFPTPPLSQRRLPSILGERRADGEGGHG
jgi:hypothetical protein